MWNIWFIVYFSCALQYRCIKSHIDKWKQKLIFLNVWEDHKNHSNPYIHNTIVLCDIIIKMLLSIAVLNCAYTSAITKLCERASSYYSTNVWNQVMHFWILLCIATMILRISVFLLLSYINTWTWMFLHHWSFYQVLCIGVL